jgi:hypothetical protein
VKATFEMKLLFLRTGPLVNIVRSLLVVWGFWQEMCFEKRDAKLNYSKKSLQKRQRAANTTAAHLAGRVACELS